MGFESQEHVHARGFAELLSVAWGIIANAGGGNWEKEVPDWQRAATRWRDDYHGWHES